MRGENSIIGDNGHIVVLKNHALFTRFITKIDGITTGDGEDQIWSY